MRTIVRQARSNVISLDKAWQLVTDVSSYPKVARFCQKVDHITAVKVGGGFEDVTTILWWPMRMQHIFTVVKPPDELSFRLPLKFGGVMEQTYRLWAEDGSTYVQATIEFDLGKPIYNVLLGRLLAWRLGQMVESMFDHLRLEQIPVS